MKRLGIVCMILALLLMTAGCASQKEAVNEAETPAAVSGEAETENGQEPVSTDADEAVEITDETALAAIENYCYEKEPGLKEKAAEGKYNVFWEIESSSDKEIVVLYRSYTSALIRYYIDRVSGETYVTEFVQGITPEEQRTDESLNVRDYITGAAA